MGRYDWLQDDAVKMEQQTGIPVSVFSIAYEHRRGGHRRPTGRQIHRSTY